MDGKMIEEFKRLYESEFREPITEAEAEEKGMRLLSIFRVVYQTARKEIVSLT